VTRRQLRLARTVAAGLIIGLGVANLYWSAAQWTLSDAGAYWQAAHRLREGAELYPVVADIEASDVYRYAPWFAWLAVPFTFLPLQVAGALWSVILVLASAAAVVPLARRRAWLQVAFFFPILIGISAVGNAHALMVAWLVWGVERRSGPLWIALAASMKAVPILLALVYLGRRQWWRAAATLVITVLLVTPALLYDLSGYVTSTGKAGMLAEVPVVYGAVVVVACLVAAAMARRPSGWLAGALAVVLATPRFFVYDVTYLLVGTPEAAVRRGGSRGARGTAGIPHSAYGAAAPTRQDGAEH
jgi:hypothetical protein